MFFEEKIVSMNDIIIIINNIINFRRDKMKELLMFFKDIFSLGREDNRVKIGLSRLKDSDEPKTLEVKPVKSSKDMKLSDLMRRSA